jgi:hypothetical protein
MGNFDLLDGTSRLGGWDKSESHRDPSLDKHLKVFNDEKEVVGVGEINGHDDIVDVPSNLGHLAGIGSLK